jgi:type II secretory pathway component GspD/PulD (secretin)
MKRILALVFVLVSSLAHADVAIHLDAARVDQLATLVFGEILGLNFVMDPALSKNQDLVRVHLDLPTKDTSQAKSALVAVVESAGVRVQEKGGIYFLSMAKPEQIQEDDGFIYLPKYRQVTYLVDLVSALFKPGSFALRRGVSSSQQLGSTGSNNFTSAPGAIGSTGILTKPVDNGTNAFSQLDKQPDVLVFKGSAKDFKRLQSLLEQIDTPTPEVLVKAVVFEVATDKKEGSALSLAMSLLGGKIGVRVGAQSAGDYSALFQNSSLSLVYDVLSADSRFKVVSSPTLRVSSGNKAKIVVGNQTPVLGQAQLDKNGNTIQSVDYKPSGVILELQPELRQSVSELQISQQISNFVQTTTGVNNTPTLVTREISTSVGVKGDEVLVLGGLDEDKDTTSSTGPFFLPSFLRATSGEKSRSEVLLILQATRI